jgi:hypothetical protein
MILTSTPLALINLGSIIDNEPISTKSKNAFTKIEFLDFFNNLLEHLAEGTLIRAYLRESIWATPSNSVTTLTIEVAVLLP